jgi:hypothetical protein
MAAGRDRGSSSTSWRDLGASGLKLPPRPSAASSASHAYDRPRRTQPSGCVRLFRGVLVFEGATGESPPPCPLPCAHSPCRLVSQRPALACEPPFITLSRRAAPDALAVRRPAPVDMRVRVRVQSGGWSSGAPSPSSSPRPLAPCSTRCEAGSRSSTRGLYAQPLHALRPVPRSRPPALCLPAERCARPVHLGTCPKQGTRASAAPA